MVVWLVRVSWAVLSVAAGPGLGDALSGRSDGVQTVASVGLWAGWAVVLLATLVPHPVSLTAVRVAAPLAVGWALWSGDPLALGTTALVAFLALSPPVGLAFVNGPAYPNERRFPLRPPGAVMSGLGPLAWVLGVGPFIGGVLLVAAGEVWAVAVVLVGLGTAFVFLRALHGLSRRWVVFVPAGLVLHDPMSLVDPVLFQKQVIEVLRPAPADTDSLDLTQAAAGLALELVLKEKVPMMLVRRREQGASTRLLFTPTRPGAVLAEYEERRLRR